MIDEGKWFIRKSREANPLGAWELWFQPVRDHERKHGNFPTRHQAQTVVDALNTLSFQGIRPDPQDR